MTRFNGAVRIACLLLAIPQLISAQQTATSTAALAGQSTEALLLSDEPRLVAWGAHNALLAKRRDLIPELLSLAAQWQSLPPPDPNVWNSEDDRPQEELDRRDAMAAVLDALIQMRVAVPADTLRILAPDFNNPVAVLLSRMPREQAVPLALEFYQSSASSQPSLKSVSAAILALHPPPGFAADLLSDITIPAFVMVVRAGGERFGAGIGGPDCFFPGWGGLRKDWPSTGQYVLNPGASLLDKMKSDAELLVAGIDPIYATRQETTHYVAINCGTGVSLGRDEQRRLVAEMLEVAPEAIPWQTLPEVNIEFDSPQQFNKELMAFVAGEQTKYRTTIAALLARGLLTPSEAQQCLPVLRLYIRDMRQQENAPLIIKPANLPMHVEWSDGI